MQLFPSFARFKSLSEGSGLVPVWREFLFDVDTAVTAYAKLAEPPFGFLLESVVGGEQWARYTFLGTRPRGAWKLHRGRVAWWTLDRGWSDVPCDDPLADLDARLRARVPADVPELPRFWGGAVGYFGYEVVRQIERLPDPPRDDLGLPDGVLLFTDVVLAIDNLKGRARAIAAVPVEAEWGEAELRRAYDDAAARTQSLVDRLAAREAPAPLELAPEPDVDPAFRSASTREEFMAGVERIRAYIAAGDAFQVVLSQRLEFDLRARPFDVYRGLRSLNPSPYLYFLELEELSLVGSSPEVLGRVEDARVIVRPIAGTRPRGATQEDERLLDMSDDELIEEFLMLAGPSRVARVLAVTSVPNK